MKAEGRGRRERETEVEEQRQRVQLAAEPEARSVLSGRERQWVGVLAWQREAVGWHACMAAVNSIVGQTEGDAACGPNARALDCTSLSRSLIHSLPHSLTPAQRGQRGHKWEEVEG